MKFDESQRICTCNQEVDECEVWGKFKKKLKKIQKPEYGVKYNCLMDVIHEVYGDNKIIIDSSKELKALQLLIGNQVQDIRIIYLIKDIRSLVFSENNRKTSQAKMDKDGWKRFYRTLTIRNAYRWYRRNKMIKEFLQEKKFSYFQLGYEELCFQPEEMLKKICDFIEISYEENMLIPANSESHIIRGNEMRFNKENLQKIRYDTRWLQSPRGVLRNILFYPFMNFNQCNVYSNIDGSRKG